MTVPADDLTSTWKSGRVEVFSYPCTIIGRGVDQHGTSYEVHLDGTLVRRFLYIDLGEGASDLAISFATGLSTGLRLATEDPRTVDVESTEFREMITATLKAGRNNYPKSWVDDTGIPSIVDTLISSFRLVLKRSRHSK